MATQATTQKLNSGYDMPALGFGTWQDKDDQEQAVLEALKAGCRHIDGARIYGTEAAVGKAIKTSGVPRSELFITTKLWNNAHHPDDVEKQCDDSLKDLGIDYLDLYLMHWPVAFKRGETLNPRDENDKLITSDVDYVDAWKGMEGLVNKGKVRSIGISNFSQAQLERLISKATIKPADHQMEIHPYLQQKSFNDFHKKHGIHITQYSPFGNSNPIYTSGEHLGKLIDDPVLAEIGKKYNKTGAQVALAWGITSGRAVIPKSKTPSRIRSNLESDFKLDGEDMDRISKLDKKFRFNDPSAGFGMVFFEDLEGKKK